MVRRVLLALALAIGLAPLGGAQLPPTPLDPVLGEVKDGAKDAQEEYVGPELSREDVDVSIDMEFTSVDFDSVNVIFGGGRFEANARISARIDMSVIAASRVREALDGVAPPVGNVTALALSEADYIPADAFRASLAGEALAAFQDEQEERLSEFIADSIPNVTVVSARFEWSNFSPDDSFEDPSLPNDPVTGGPPSAYDVNDPAFPPLTLDAVVQVQYLERTNLLKIIEKALEPKSEAEKERKAQVADARASYERSAFGLLGIRQVLDLQAFEGWNIAVRVHLPDGYTFEEASPDVILGQDLREAEVLTLGKDASGTVLNPVSLTLSNRFLVSIALLGSVLLAGTILRFPILLGVNAWRRFSRRP